MNRRIAFAAAVIALGTLAGCSRTDNPLAPTASARGASSHFDGSSVPPTGASSSTTSSDSTKLGTGDVIWTQGGN
jgi:hypothetical protein